MYYIISMFSPKSALINASISPLWWPANTKENDYQIIFYIIQITYPYVFIYVLQKSGIKL
jgi:hypothetical protein